MLGQKGGMYMYVNRFSSVQSLSCVWSFATPWTVAYQASLSITNSQSLLKLMSIELVMLFYHRILHHSLLLLPSIFPNIRVFSSESVFLISWPKCWSISFSISPSNEYLPLISFRIDWFDLLAVQGTLKSLLHTTVQKHQFFSAQLSSQSAGNGLSHFIVQPLYVTGEERDKNEAQEASGKRGSQSFFSRVQILDSSLLCLCFILQHLLMSL